MVDTMDRSFDGRAGERGVRVGSGTAAQPMRSKAFRSALIAALLTAGSSTAGLAQATPEERAACTPDVFSLCSWYVPNAGKITSCLVRNKGRLSSGCYNALQRRGLVP